MTFTIANCQHPARYGYKSRDLFSELPVYMPFLYFGEKRLFFNRYHLNSYYNPQTAMKDHQHDHQLTSLLNSVEENSESINRVLPLVYDELRALAHRELRRERNDHTLNTTALVHEAYMKLIRHPPNGNWDGRRHFFGIAARAMRQILVNYAKKRNRQKRGGNSAPIPFEEGIYMSDEKAGELVALDEALERLEKLNERQVQVVECRYFGGYNIEETAEVLGISPATVKRDWTLARAWLHSQIRPPDHSLPRKD